MPTYDYQCRDCGAMTEVIHSMLEDGPSSCERCGGQLRRVLYPAGIIFKGSGFYKTDSRAGSNGSTQASGGGTSTSAPSDSGSGAGEASTSSGSADSATKKTPDAAGS